MMHGMRASAPDRHPLLLPHRVGQSLHSAVAGVLLSVLLLSSSGCSQETILRQKEERRALERLALVEILLPLPPDSIRARYRNYDSVSFVERYAPRLFHARSLIDSLNGGFPDSLRIDTLAIDHTLQDFGEAGRRRNILIVSSAYFVVYDNPAVLRSVIFHEFGHLAYERLSRHEQDRFSALWVLMGRNALFYLFRDAEYSGNARFGGHPEDSPSELFASAFNLLRNQPEEFRSRVRYIEDIHRGAIAEIAAMTAASVSLLE